ncbi:MAG: YtxH domain-containing protein [Alistipes sp.]|jgi:gas vesicle protein|nr:YtxH domain-containing protein [Alistipes sp.]
MRNCHSGSAFGAFVGGALIGGVLALLFAPRSGAETRGMIRDFVDDNVEKVKDKAVAARDYVEGEVAKYTRRARRAVHKVEGKIEDAVAGAADRVEGEISAIKKAVARR